MFYPKLLHLKLANQIFVVRLFLLPYYTDCILCDRQCPKCRFEFQDTCGTIRLQPSQFLIIIIIIHCIVKKNYLHKQITNKTQKEGNFHTFCDSTGRIWSFTSETRIRCGPKNMIIAILIKEQNVAFLGLGFVTIIISLTKLTELIQKPLKRASRLSLFFQSLAHKQ